MNRHDRRKAASQARGQDTMGKSYTLGGAPESVANHPAYREGHRGRGGSGPSLARATTHRARFTLARVGQGSRVHRRRARRGRELPRRQRRRAALARVARRADGATALTQSSHVGAAPGRAHAHARAGSGLVTWRERAICLDCQRTLHGPGTGPVGPRPRPRSSRPDPRCAFCASPASPAARMRLWQDEEDPWTD